MFNILRPTNQLVKSYILKFNNNTRYYPADQAIINLFVAFPNNKRLEDILLKISVINDLYSTNIFGTFRMAEHILKLNIDEDLKLGNPSIINRIASGHDIRTKKNDKEISFYSFATKYCSWHNQEDFAIYDSFVEKILLAYRKKDNFSKFSKNNLREFSEYKRIIKDFIVFYDLTEYSLKEIDKFLWIYGKEIFPASYS